MALKKSLTVLTLNATTVVFAGNHKDERHVAIGMTMPSFSYEIKHKATDADPSESSLVFSPKVSDAVTVETAAFGLTLGTSFDLASDDEEEATEEKTKTTFKSYDLSLFRDHFGISASYITLKGMNITEATGVDESTLGKDRDAHRPDITIKDTCVNLWAAPLSYNFSLANFFDPASKSMGSGIGLVIAGSYDDLEEKSAHQLVPQKYSAPYGSDAGLMGGHFTSTAVMVGPAVTLSVAGFYVSGLFELGQGKQRSVYKNADNGQHQEDRTSTKTEMYTAAGYKGASYFTGINYSMDSTEFDMESVTLSTTKDVLNFMVGARF